MSATISKPETTRQYDHPAIVDAMPFMDSVG